MPKVLVQPQSCKRATMSQIHNVAGELKQGFCPKADARHLDRLLSRCHNKLPSKLETLANEALNRYEEKCGTYLDKGRWELGRAKKRRGRR